MTDKESKRITVSTLQSLYANSLSSTLDGVLLMLEGFYFQTNDKLYGKYYYTEIVGKEKQHKITALFTPQLKQNIINGKYYQFEGFITRAKNISNDSRLNVNFVVTKVVKHEKEVQLISKVEYDIVQARFERDFPLIDDLLLRKIQNDVKPKLDVITGVQSTSQDDYLSQLPDADMYSINHHRCNLSSKDDLLRFLNTYDFKNTDLLIILRGGGSGLEVFNQIDLCKKAIELPVPFITGIGHDADKTLLEKVADRGFSTPTAVGAFLQKTVSTHKERAQLIKFKDEELVRLQKRADNEKLALQQQIRVLTKALNSFKVMLAVLVAMAALLIYHIVTR